MSTNENKGKKAEVTALQAISAEDRKDWISLAFVQAGICVCVPAFLLGALLAEAMPIWPAIISGSLGYLIVVVGMVATGMIGCDLGLASCTCCQAGFGKSGARFIVSTIFAVNMIGWFGIQNGVCGEAFSNAMLAMTGWDIPVVVSNTIWGIIMLLTAVYGVHALEKLDKISIPLLMIIMCYGTFLAFKVYGTGNLNDEGKNVPIFPMGVATKFGEKIVIQNVADDLRAEDIVRAIAVVSDNLVGVADHANVGKVIKNSLIPGAITYAQEIGRVLRETKEAGGDVASAICDDKEGKVLFRGHISDYTCETRDGFNFGEIHLKGERDYTDEAYRIWFKNENIISYRNGEVDVIAPDLICMINGEGNPMTTPNFEVGDKMTVIALPSPEIWTTPEGLECFGPKHFGFDVEYKPFEK